MDVYMKSTLYEFFFFNIERQFNNEMEKNENDDRQQ